MGVGRSRWRRSWRTAPPATQRQHRSDALAVAGSAAVCAGGQRRAARRRRRCAAWRWRGSSARRQTAACCCRTAPWTATAAAAAAAAAVAVAPAERAARQRTGGPAGSARRARAGGCGSPRARRRAVAPVPTADSRAPRGRRWTRAGSCPATRRAGGQGRRRRRPRPGHGCGTGCSGSGWRTAALRHSPVCCVQGTHVAGAAAAVMGVAAAASLRLREPAAALRVRPTGAGSAARALMCRRWCWQRSQGARRGPCSAAVRSWMSAAAPLRCGASRWVSQQTCPDVVCGEEEGWVGLRRTPGRRSNGLVSGATRRRRRRRGGEGETRSTTTRVTSGKGDSSAQTREGGGRLWLWLRLWCAGGGARCARADENGKTSTMGLGWGNR